MNQDEVAQLVVARDAVAQLAHNNQYSIELTRNAKGDYQYAVKMYFDGDDQASIGRALVRMRTVEAVLYRWYIAGAAQGQEMAPEADVAALLAEGLS